MFLGGMMHALSRPRPLYITSSTEAEVFAYAIREPESIYLWLKLPGVNEPRSFVIPYTLEKAKELKGATDAARETGRNARMLPPEDGDPTEPVFHPPPPPAHRPKETISDGDH
jgi:hypothetical protein